MNKVLQYGVQNGASDIHFRPGDAPSLRIDGQLRPIKAEKLAYGGMSELSESEILKKFGPLNKTRSHQLWFALTHFFNHQTHHRGQVTALLNQLGRDYGVTDFPIMYDLAQGVV